MNLDLTLFLSVFIPIIIEFLSKLSTSKEVKAAASFGLCLLLSFVQILTSGNFHVENAAAVFALIVAISQGADRLGIQYFSQFLNQSGPIVDKPGTTIVVTASVTETVAIPVAPAPPEVSIPIPEVPTEKGV